MSALTKGELVALHRIVTAAHLPAELRRDLDLEERVRAGELAERLARVIAELRPVEEKGELVLSWRIARQQAPTLNEYAFLKGWQKKRLRGELDALLRGLLPAWPKADLHCAQRKRWVRATRFSPNRVDEVSLDVLGAKMPLDALTRCGVLHDDDGAFLVREGRWEKCKRGETCVLLEVFEVTTEGKPVAAPMQGVAPAGPPRELGAFTRAIKEAG